MRVKYQTRYVETQFSTVGGTNAENGNFFRAILEALIDMGAPLFELANGDNYASALFNGENGPLGIFIGGRTEGTAKYLVVTGFGFDGNYFNSEEVMYGGTTGKYAGVCIHAIQSGDAFYFGFLSPDMYPSLACINYAIVPMRRLSDPSANLGYALLKGLNYVFQNSMDIGSYPRTLPNVEGFNYSNGYLNWTSALNVNAFPETDTGKIPLVPLYAGIEDIYYDKVYISPMWRNADEEKAFETDKGVFLISGPIDYDGVSSQFCPLAFDITEAVNSAQ